MAQKSQIFTFAVENNHVSVENTEKLKKKKMKIKTQRKSTNFQVGTDVIIDTLNLSLNYVGNKIDE